MVIEFFEGQRARVQSGRQLHRMSHGATGHRDRSGSATAKCFGRLFTNFAGSNQQHTGIGEITKNSEGQIDRHIGSADLSGVDGGLRADLFGRLEGLLEHAVEHGADGARGQGIGVGVFDLAENFVFPH